MSEKTLSKSSIQRIRSLVEMHHKWRKRCINLIASENVTSPAIREILASDLAHRYAEGEPYNRMYQGTRYVDEVEASALSLAKKIFRAEHVNLKPVSGCMVNQAVFYALTKPNDTVMTLSLSDGGHISYMSFGGAGVRGLKTVDLPFNPEEMNIDLDAASDTLQAVKPTLCILGGSVLLFPHPVREIKRMLEEQEGYLVYDASHVLGLVAGRCFQDPLREGSDVMVSSIHKTFPGPQGGIIFCRKSLAEKIDHAVFPGLVSNHHLPHVAGLAVALMEMQRFGAKYAVQMIKNAKALAEALYNNGFNVLCTHKGFTESHQVLFDVSEYGGGKQVAELLEEANIICNKNLLPGDGMRKAYNPSGIRLGTAEVTRLGFKESDMQQVARFIKLVVERKTPKQIAAQISKFMEEFSEVKYCFQKNAEAYRYVKFY